MKIQIREGFPVDMAKIFRAWFRWGFWGSIIQILIIVSFIVVYKFVQGHEVVKAMVFLSVQSINCVSTVLWFMCGLFWRFSRAGRVVSGEKLVRTAEVSDEEWEMQLDGAHTGDGYQFYAGSFMSMFLWFWLTLFIAAITALVLYGLQYSFKNFAAEKFAWLNEYMQSLQSC